MLLFKQPAKGTIENVQILTSLAKPVGGKLSISTGHNMLVK